jgi:hypothetical protein
MTYNVNKGFGSGYMFMTPLGTAIAQPIRVGILQDISMDISFDEKPLYGQGQWAYALARGKAKGACKAKFAQIDSLAMGQVFFGVTPVAGQNQIVDLEAHSVPASTAYTVQVTNHTNFGSDEGVFYAATMQPLQNAGTAAVSTGTYSLNTSTGTYTFAAGDASAALLFSYEWNDGTSGKKTSVTDQPMGTATYFSVDLFENDPETGAQWGARLYRCMSSKLNIASKQDDWTIPEFDFSMQRNAAGQVLDFNSPN